MRQEPSEAPQPTDVICDPACGTAGFLVAAGEYLRERHPNLLHDSKLNEHFHHRMFHGFDFDNTMLRIGSMNMLLHGVESPDIRYRDSLAQDHAGEEEKYTLVLDNPPFAGNLDHENISMGKAGRKRWLGRKPVNRGVVMNPVDHPHGGGEGKTSGGRHPVTPWGQPTRGFKTRNNKRTDKFVVQRRK